MMKEVQVDKALKICLYYIPGLVWCEALRRFVSRPPMEEELLQLSQLESAFNPNREAWRSVLLLLTLLKRPHLSHSHLKVSGSLSFIVLPGPCQGNLPASKPFSTYGTYQGFTEHLTARNVGSRRCRRLGNGEWKRVRLGRHEWRR